MQSIETMLRKVPGFAQLDGESLEHVAAAGDLAEADAGDVLFREGSLPESLYVLLDGRVSLTGTAADASSTVIDILGPASSFVLANVLTDEPYLMGAQAVSQLAAGADRGRADAAGGGGAAGGRDGDDARDVGRTRQHDAPGGGPEGARRGAAAGHLSAEPGEGPDRDASRVPAAGEPRACWRPGWAAAPRTCRAPSWRCAPTAWRRMARACCCTMSRACGPMPARRRAAPPAQRSQPVEKVFGDAFRLRPAASDEPDRTASA